MSDFNVLQHVLEPKLIQNIYKTKNLLKTTER